MTLDGKIAPPPSESHHPTALGGGDATGGWITSEVARAHVQELRHQHDAILVGVGTIIADDPLLTDRSGLPRRRPLLRVILDSRLRLPLESRVVKTAQDDVLVLCSFAEENKKRQLQQLGIRVEQIPRGGCEMDTRTWPAIARLLGRLEITSLMIEGGAMVNGAALASGIVDKVFSTMRRRFWPARVRCRSPRPRIRPHAGRGVREVDSAASVWRRFRGGGILAGPVPGTVALAPQAPVQPSHPSTITSRTAWPEGFLRGSLSRQPAETPALQ